MASLVKLQKDYNMESMKQAGIIVLYNKKNKSKTSETGNCQNRKEANISRPIANVEQTTKRTYPGKFSVTGKRNEKEICQTI